ncbi:MAG: MFS transporter [Candidatus Competibacterales bacterium]|nr:MFS transporter [Candidatus Competibacterales bacterium]
MTPGPFLPTVAMLGVMSIASLGVFAVAVCAPEAAPDLGLPTTLIGVYSALVYGVAMFAGTQTGPLIERYGVIRVNQFTVLLAAAAMLVFALGTPLAALASALLLGCAYGQCNPASAHVLIHLGQPRWRPLIFSIKQTGVPLGGVLAGLLLPPLIDGFDWPLALGTAAGLSLLVLLPLLPLRAAFDDREPRSRHLRLRLSLRAPVRQVLDTPALRGATLAALVYSGAQLSVGAYFVVYLVEDLGLPLVLAGAVFAAIQIGGVGGRLLWGALAGRLGAWRLLGLIGLVTTASLLITALLLAPDWPRWLLLGFGGVLGASSFGWNGVFMAEVAALAPSGRVSQATGAAQFFIYGGVVLLPPAFGLLVGLSGAYAPVFGLLALLVGGASLYFLLAPTGCRADSSPA